MSTAEVKIKDALIRFNGAIKSSDGAALSRALAELDALLAAHRQELPPQLVHYLGGRSYAKATAWLGIDDIARATPPPGGCGRARQ